MIVSVFKSPRRADLRNAQLGGGFESMVDDSGRAITDDQVEAVRSLLLFSRSMSGLGIRRQDLCVATGVRGPDLDNFLTKHKGTGVFRTRRPHDRILSRLI